MKRLLTLFSLVIAVSLTAFPQKITILHTNDMHSRLMGFGPESDYTPLTTNDDHTIGGFARIAGFINEHKNRIPESLVVVDAGDFSMGTLFHTMEAETGFQLRLMKKMGYDVIALGNHEFDLGIGNLAKMVGKSAEQPIPSLLLSNIAFNDTASGDDSFEALYKSGVIKTWRVIERNGLRLGFFSLMGVEAAEVAPYVAPASFTDRLVKAAEMVTFLRQDEKADIVICLSHSGIVFDPKKGWTGDDVEMAEKVPGIDVIISGHTHTDLVKPLIVNDIPIVQAGGEGRYIGKIEFEKTPGGFKFISGEIIPVNDQIPGDPAIEKLIHSQQDLIAGKLFKPHGFDIDKPVVETSYDLNFGEHTYLENSNLGPFLADALYGYLKENSPADVVVVPAGIVRDQIQKGLTGKQLPADLFRIFPLGLGVYDQAPGYSMSKVYITGRELKTLLDAMMIASKMATGNFPYWSGVKYSYNGLRMPLDQVYDIRVGNEKDGYQPVSFANDGKLYSVATNSYVLNFFSLVGRITKGIVKVVPKDASGQPLADLNQAVIDLDPGKSGIQEAKEWIALMTYASKLPDLNGNGIPDIPEKYREIIHSSEKNNSINPVTLFRGTNGLTVVPAVLEAGLVAGLLLVIL
jgi:5'-nucleotidase